METLKHDQEYYLKHGSNLERYYPAVWLLCKLVTEGYTPNEIDKKFSKASKKDLLREY